MKRSIFALSIVVFVPLLGCAGLAEKNGSALPKTPSAPVLWLDSKEIDLGTIPSGQDMLVGMIPIMNDGDEALEILRGNGHEEEV